jgi:prepilin-type N-terminal cleavage/methylation domain-containing protein
MAKRIRGEKGFSLIELLVSVGILLFMMAVVFRQVAKLQDMSRTEDMKRDVVQNAREVLDQLSRDVHTAGFPSKRMFHNNTSYTACNVTPCSPLAGTAENNVSVATAGFVVIATNEFVIEGDVDGDGNVDSVGYRIIPNGAGNAATCPCLQRSQVNKLAGDPKPTGWGGAQVTTANYSTILDNIIAPANGTYFTYYDSTGTAISPGAGTTFPNVPGTIRTVELQLRVQTRAQESMRNFRPQSSFTITAKMGNY